MIKRIARTGYGIAALLGLWFLLYLWVESAIIPSPPSTLRFFAANFWSVMVPHMARSLFRIGVAIVLSTAVGLPAGIWMGLSKFGDRLFTPVVYMAYPIPKIAFIPVFMVLLGLGDASKIGLIFTIIVFQMMIGVRDGIDHIPKEVHLSAKSLDLSAFQRLRHIILPAILPGIFTSLRISSGIAISALFLSENYATEYGIGYYIMNNWTMVDYPAMFAGIVGLSLMGLFLFGLIDAAQRFLCPWL